MRQQGARGCAADPISLTGFGAEEEKGVRAAGRGERSGPAEWPRRVRAAGPAAGLPAPPELSTRLRVLRVLRVLQGILSIGSA